MCCMLETVGRQTKYDCLPRMGEQEKQILDWQTDKYCRQILANIDAQGRKCCQMPTNIVAILHMREAGCSSPLIESKWPVGVWYCINSGGLYGKTFIPHVNRLKGHFHG